MFRKLQPFDLPNVRAVPHALGVYILYTRDGVPFYVGRSRIDMFNRLWRHINRVGSKKIREALNHGTRFEFEFQEMFSVEQAEAVLIKELGVLCYGNLRRESDPADWT